MRRIAIIGCGSSALLLGLGLLKKGDYDIVIYSDRSAEDWLNNSPPTGTPFVAGENIDLERTLGIEYWENEMFFGDGVMLDFHRDREQPPLTIRGRFNKLGAAVDLRLRIHRWMSDFEARGGSVINAAVALAALETIAAKHDLTVLATGKGELGELVPRDPERSEFDAPQRKLFASIVAGIQGWGLRNKHLTRPVKFTFIADAGEWFFVPFTHKDIGPSYAWNFCVRPGGALDRFDACRNCEQFIAVARDCVAEFAPEDLPALGAVAPVPDRFNYFPFQRGIQPLVRMAFGTLPSGAMVVPLGDAAIVYDPIGGQGYNSAARHARMLTDAIVAHGNRTFDSAWACAAFDDFWEDHGRWACAWNNAMLRGLPPATGLVLERAAQDRVIADAVFGHYFRPRGLFPWIADLAEAESQLQRYDRGGQFPA